MKTAFQEFRDKNVGLQIVCTACGEVFTELTSETMPRQFDYCPCGKSGFDWGDGWYTRMIGQARRKRD